MGGQTAGTGQQGMEQKFEGVSTDSLSPSASRAIRTPSFT